MTVRQILKAAEERLKSAQIENAKFDAEELFLYVSGWNRTRLLFERDSEAEEKTVAEFNGVITRRASHEPLQLITGKAPFYGYEFLVDGNVLIPRFDTEVLVHEALETSKRGKFSVLDMCTGSGCIACTLALEGNFSVVDAADVSEAALQMARKNAANLRAKVRFFRSDLFSALDDCYDMIVSNPPYIRRGDIAGLTEEVRSFDPMLALDGGADGLIFYRRITAEGKAHLNKGGWIFYEIGADQGADVSEILRENGFENIRVIQDLSGLDRVVAGQLMNSEEADV